VAVALTPSFLFGAAGCGSGGAQGQVPYDASGESVGDGAAGADATASDVVEESTDAPADGATTECIAKINAYRAKLSAPPVTSKDDEVACALDQATKGAEDLADSGVTKFHKYFHQCSESFQNECWYSVSDPSAVIDWCLAAFWAEGPPDTGINHYSVMTDPKSTQVACALYAMPRGGYWMTNDYY
jgi:hypothetical protein